MTLYTVHVQTQGAMLGKLAESALNLATMSLECSKVQIKVHSNMQFSESQVQRRCRCSAELR